jgi:hypothetical protein
MKVHRLLLIAVVFVLAQGCAAVRGVSSYTPVDLGRNLDATALARYRTEVEQAAAAGQAGHAIVLERTNWWPLGLLAYWKRGEVKTMTHAEGNTLYVVSESRGYGPLSIGYVSGRTAVYGSDGRRMHGMGIASVFWGHLAMLHSMDFELGQGRWHTHKSAGFLHHMVNVVEAHGKRTMSLFSNPNAATFGD